MRPILPIGFAEVVVLAGGLMAGVAQATVSIEVVGVGDAGNAADTNGFGRVGYVYQIGKYEVTAGQYCMLLNAVARTDTYGLYNTAMDTSDRGCQITRHGVSGSYTYDFSGRPSGTEADWANRPVNFVGFWDACRFANWLHNGQPTGAQNSSTTEGGAYTLSSGGIAGNTITRNTAARWAVTSEDEWYKAAYYKGGSTNVGYWPYPTDTDATPGRDLADVSGNNANYRAYPYPIDSGIYTTLVGEFQDSSGPYGTFDQGGNVLEWTEGIIATSLRALRGGSFSSDTSGLQPSHRVNYYPTVEGWDCGFRVTLLPEPASLGLVGLGVAVLFGLRRPVRRRGVGRG